MTRMIKLASLAFAIIGFNALINEPTAAQRIRLETKLVSTKLEPIASGSAKFEMRPGRIKFSTEVEDLLATTLIQVYVNKDLMGITKVDQFGFADLNLDSQLGDKVPRVFPGDMVEVLDQKGNLILFGILRSRFSRSGAEGG